MGAFLVDLSQQCTPLLRSMTHFDFWLGGIYGYSVVDLLEQAGPEIDPWVFMHLEAIPVPPGFAIAWPRLTIS